MSIRIEKYNTEYKSVWDDFVSSSRNGTFLFYRGYMEYHSGRFQDYSLMFFEKNKLVALLPANISEQVFYSHQGLTYGGLILSEDTKTPQTIEVIDTVVKYLQESKVSKIIYKPIPHIYHRYPSEDDLYALFRNKAILISRNISSSINLSDKLGYSELRRRQIKKAEKQNLIVCESDSLPEFWAVLEENLKKNHQAVATHSLDEIAYLRNQFPDNIRLFCTLKENRVVAGCLIFETATVAHAQYISASQEGKECGALDLLFDYLIDQVFTTKKYFDFGTSNEDNGYFLNEGLISQKEGFGARGVVYDTYQLNITL
uniref:GNAT family N-acetyltransferase n=1 Tax=uncultured Dysgonomonas sp. TaxID=206096 RepID=UPI002620EF8B|nr:GNAT family N-acetyltransferase [uncultured Dysgonomonas sp.]